MTQAYTLILHPVANGARLKPVVTRLDVCPDIEKTSFGRWVRYVEVIAPRPLEFTLHHRDDAQFPCPTSFTTLYFPNGHVRPFAELIDTTENEDQAAALYRLAVKGLAHDYYLAGGKPEAETDPEETDIIVTADNEELFAFAANCVLLKPAWHPPKDDPHPDKIWDRVNKRLYGMGIGNLLDMS